jgi:hypothetical membrane protein
MLVYPGGYSFFTNYFSQIGFTQINGQANGAGYVLFVLACTSAAICVVLFSLSLRTVFTKPASVKYLAWIGTILAVIAAPFLATLAILAGDIFPAQHGLSTVLFFLLYAIAIVIYSIDMLLNKSYNYLYSLVGFIVAALCLVYILAIGTALMQKVAVYALVLWSAFQGYALMKMLK